MRVSLVATVKDAADRIEAFVAAIAAQTRAPDEIVIVDGGSRDGTRERLAAAPTVRLIDAPGANIARGRNLAVAAATGDVIAVSDADCEPSPTWLADLVAEVERGADVAMGVTAPIAPTPLTRAMAAVNLPLPDELDARSFLPSARSVAFRRAAIEAVGGWPEWLDIGEDMWVDLRWRALGLDLRLVRSAVVGWPLRRGVVETWRQYFRYARGDALAGMHPRRHAIRFGTYVGAAAVVASGWTPALVVGAIAAAAYVAGPVRRAVRRGGPALPLVIGLVPALMALTDLAKMAGWIAGAGARGRAGRPADAGPTGPGPDGAPR